MRIMHHTTRMINVWSGAKSAVKHGSVSREIISFGTALRRYLAILLALLRREEESRRAAPIESIVSLLQPVILAGSFSLMRWFFDKMATAPTGGNQFLFYATGFFAHYLFNYSAQRMRRSVDSPSRRFPIEQRLDHSIVHIILCVIDYSILGVLIFGAIYLLNAQAAPYEFIPMIQACAAIVMLAFGWGVLNLVMTRAWWAWPHCFSAFNRCLLFLSGSLFLADFLPPNIRYVLSFNPLLHAITLFRMGFYRNQPTLLLDTAYLSYCAIFALIFGLVLERVTRRSEGR